MLIYIISDDRINFVKIYAAAIVPQLAKVNKSIREDFFFCDFSWPNERLVQNFYLISDAHIHNI